MTIGIGGWGSRRKPMAAVRAILRSDLTDLTVVSYGGPDVGLLCAAGKVAKVVYGFVTLDSIPTDPHFKAARQSGAVEAMEVDEGMFYLGLLAASQRIPFLPTRSGLGSDVLTVNPSLRTVRSPYDDGEELVAMPALRLDAAVVHVNRADAAGSGQILGPDPFFDELFLGAADRRFVTTERVVADRRSWPTEGPIQTMCISRLLTDGVIETPGRRPLHRVRPRLRARRGRSRRSTWPPPATPRRGPRSATGSSTVDEDGYQAATREAADGAGRGQGRQGGRMSESTDTGVTRAEYCADRLRRGVPGRRRGHGERLRHRARTRRPPRPAHLRPRPRPDRRRRRAGRRRAPARRAARRRWSSSPTCPTAGSSTWCGRGGAT